MRKNAEAVFQDLKKEILENANSTPGAQRSLPPLAYANPDLLRHELTTLFSSEWICVGRTAQMPEGGDYVTFELQEHPILVIRQEDGSIRAFANICVHRCARLLTQSSGHCTRISCPYHSWTYALNGQLIGAPFMQQTPQFSQQLKTRQLHLKSLACDTWQGFIYVSLNPAPNPIAERLAGLDNVLGQFRVADYVPVIEEEETWNANWKCLVENFVDSYHIHRVHRDSFGAFGASEEFTTLLPGGQGYAWQCVDADPEQRTRDRQMIKRPMAHKSNTWLSNEWRNRTLVAVVFPAHTMQLEADMLWHLSIQPIGTERLKVKWWVAVPGEILADQPDEVQYVEDLKRFLNIVNGEDRTIVENVHANLMSNLAVPGPMSFLERNVFEFGQYLARSLESEDESV